MDGARAERDRGGCGNTGQPAIFVGAELFLALDALAGRSSTAAKVVTAASINPATSLRTIPKPFFLAGITDLLGRPTGLAVGLAPKELRSHLSGFAPYETFGLAYGPGAGSPAPEQMHPGYGINGL